MSNRKLLLADDSITIQKVVNLTFADEGIEVVCAGDGDAAMTLLNEFVPDVVLADVNMPGPNGYQICDIIRKREETRHVPVILLVGSFEPFDEEEALRVGANNYLTKPFQSIRQLVTAVSELLDNKNVETDSPEEESHTETPSESTDADIDNLYRESFAETVELPNSARSFATFGDTGLDDDLIETEYVENRTGLSDQSQGFENDDLISQETFAEFNANEANDEASEDVIFDTIRIDDTDALTDDLPEATDLEIGDEFSQPENGFFDDDLVETESAATIDPAPDEPGAEFDSIPDDREVEPADSPNETESETTSEFEPFTNGHDAAIAQPIDFVTEPAIDGADKLTDDVNEEYLSPAATEEPSADFEILPSVKPDEFAQNDDDPNVLELPFNRPVETTSVRSELEPRAASEAQNMSPEFIDAVAQKVAEKISETLIRQIAWLVVPQIAESVAREREKRETQS